MILCLSFGKCVQLESEAGGREVVCVTVTTGDLFKNVLLFLSLRVQCGRQESLQIFYAKMGFNADNCEIAGKMEK